MKKFTVNELSKLYQVDSKTIRRNSKRWGARYVPGTGIQIPFPPTDQPTMKPLHVAHIIGVSIRVVQRWCKDGVVKSFRIGSLWRIDYKDGIQLIKKRKLGYYE